MLVPLYPSLSAQLHAIAREYALPSSAGLLLYLVNSTPHTTADPPPDGDAPGPCLSEAVWRHIWARVLRADAALLDVPSRAGTPLHGLGLMGGSVDGGSIAAPRSPALRPLISPRPKMNTDIPPFGAYPLTPAPSTPSSTSDPHRRPSLDVESPLDGEIPDLPGLGSSSLIPILAKVEFEVDRLKAGWYEPWLRNRKSGHAKRAGSSESRSRSRGPASRSTSGAEGEEGEEAKARLLELELVTKRSMSPRSMLRAASVASEDRSDIEADESGYAPLEDEPSLNGGDEASTRAIFPERSFTDSEAEDADTSALRAGVDPLADVFGTDEQTWAELRAANPKPLARSDQSIVDLTLDASQLSVPLDDEGDTSLDSRAAEEALEISEVEALWNRQSRPQLQIETSPPEEGEGRRRASSTATVKSKHIPPPLTLPPLPSAQEGLSPTPSPGLGAPTPSTASGGSTQLPYVLGGATPEPSPGLEGTAGKPTEGSEDGMPAKLTSPEEKRGGAFYDDLDLELDVSELDGDDTVGVFNFVKGVFRANIYDQYDENDPNDRRRSQFLMQKQLDEIEKVRSLKSFQFDRALIHCVTDFASALSEKSV